MELASASRRLQKSMKMFNPERLSTMKRSGAVVAMVPPWKLVMKMLNQNFCRMGERMIVKETTKRLLKMAVTVAFLKQERRRPKPITVKIEARMKRLPQMVWEERVTGEEVEVVSCTSLAHPYTQRIPNNMTSTIAPAARLLVLLKLLLPGWAGAESWGWGWTSPACILLRE